MARGFGTTYGVSGTMDKITTAYTAAASSAYSLAAWVFVNGKGANSFGNVVNQQTSSGGAANFVLFLNNSTTSFGFSHAFSTTNGEWTFNGSGTGVWQHIAITYNSSSTSNSPVIYVNGASVSASVASAPAGTASNSSQNIKIGNGATNANAWDGKLAEVSYWNGSILTASEIRALAKGVPPLLIRRPGLSLYLPLLGASSGEPDWGPSHVAQTMSGTAKQNHAPVSFWMPAPSTMPAVFFTGSLALAQGSAAAAISAKEKFHAAAAAVQQNATLSITAQEKFSTHLSLAAPANLALIDGYEIAAAYPGRAVISDAAQGGFLALADRPAFGLASADAALFDVQITESI